MIDSLSRVIIKNNLHKICVPVRAQSLQEVFRLAKRARKRVARYLEIWLDSVPVDSFLEFKKYRFLYPYIAVCKSKKEKGSFQGTEKARLDILISAALHGANFVDIGINVTPEKLLKKVIARIQKTNTKIILSYHNFRTTPPLATLMKICQKAFGLGADIVKIAITAKRSSDNVTLFELASRLKKEKKKFIVVTMGEKGVIGRLGGVVLGGFLTYAAIGKTRKTAPGQLFLAEKILKV